MSMIEVRANLSFGKYRQGRHYQLDGDDPTVQNQVYAGYFKVVNVLGGDVANAPAGRVPDTGVDTGTPGPKKRGRPRKEVTDGTGEHLPGEGSPVRTSGDDAAGPQDS